MTRPKQVQGEKRMSACLSEMNVYWTDGMSMDPVGEFIERVFVFGCVLKQQALEKCFIFLDVSLSLCLPF